MVPLDTKNWITAICLIVPRPSMTGRHSGTSVFALRGQADRISVFSRQSRPRAVNGLEDGFFFLALRSSSTFSADNSLARAPRIMSDFTYPYAGLALAV
ncbi:hypothetical protein IG631_24090 [Alternaria alternata]|nr:hypothetical protein IG631_24090 [Alternaria alternata]